MTHEEILKRINQEIVWRELFMETTPPYLGTAMHKKVLDELEFFKSLRRIAKKLRRIEKHWKNPARGPNDKRRSSKTD